MREYTIEATNRYSIKSDIWRKFCNDVEQSGKFDDLRDIPGRSNAIRCRAVLRMELMKYGATMVDSVIKFKNASDYTMFMLTWG